ncbi:MAG TPA: hypothetical protein VHZ07_00960 [Bryobacteraceae bacterium]|nr:hypothetical protein [Bryobacteraceae bacterium]
MRPRSAKGTACRQYSTKESGGRAVRVLREFSKGAKGMACRQYSTRESGGRAVRVLREFSKGAKGMACRQYSAGNLAGFFLEGLTWEEWRHRCHEE